MKQIRVFFILFIVMMSSAASALEAELQAPQDTSNAISEVYRDIIVVQRRAKEKAGKRLLNVSVATDFSDGPQAIYSLSFSFGYAFTDEFEAFLSFTPFFMTQDRPIKQSVADLTLQNGQKASLESPKPSMQYALDLLWVPAYGKDSWGPHSIIRSDTFFRFSGGVTQFEGAKGMRVSIGLGKTFYLGEKLNPRLTAGWGFRESIVNDKKALSQMGLFEAGNVWYF